MMKYYKGKDTCAGCHVSGEEKPRDSKEKLCNDCEKQLFTGRSFEAIEERKNYTHMAVRWYSLEFFNGDNGGKLLESSFLELFKTLDVKNFAYGYKDLTQGSATTASNRFSIRTDVYEKLLKVVEALEIQQSDFKEKVNTYKSKIDQEFRDNKNEIYNQGIEKGRELLFALNAGEVTMDDFNKKIVKY
jgi:hypothetical protein